MATVGLVGFGEQPADKQRVLLVRNSPKPQKRTRPSAKDGPGISSPPPVAVARRNARERNRVKQVNNGFATLRQHIPTSIASSYESVAGPRGASKKLSKVETLRMAVEYIRRLEDLLSLSPMDGNKSVSPYASSSSADVSTEQVSLTYSYSRDVSPEQYARYQLLYDNDENVKPSQLTDDLVNSPLMDAADLELSVGHGIGLLHTMHSSASLSPEVYSEHSLSPGTVDGDAKPFMNIFGGPTQLQFPAELAYDAGLIVKAEPSPAPDDASAQPTNMIMTWWDQDQKS